MSMEHPSVEPGPDPCQLPPNRRKGRRILLLVGLGLLALTPVLMLSHLNANGRAHLEKAMAEARAGGVPLTLAEIEAARKVWPDEQNGALILLRLQDRLDGLSAYRSITSLDANGGGWIELPPWFVPGKETIWISLHDRFDQTTIPEGRQVRYRFDSQIPTVALGFGPAEVVDGHRLRISGQRPWRKLEWSVDVSLSHLPLLGEAELPPLGDRFERRTHIALKALLERAAPALAELDHLADCAGGRFPIPTDAELVNLDMTWLSTMREVQRIEAVQAICQAMDGETDSLVVSILVMSRIGLLLEDEPCLISALVRVACEELVVTTLEHACANVMLTTDHLDQLDAVLASIDTDDKLYWAALGERATYLQRCDTARRDEFARPWQEQSWRYGRVPGLTGFYDRDRSRALRMLSQQVKVGQDAQALLAAIPAIRETLHAIPDGHTVVWLDGLIYARPCQMERRLASRLRAARIAIAVERFRLATSRWPSKLEELAPTFIERLPTDPLDGGPFQYHVVADGIFVHGRGLDMCCEQDQDPGAVAPPDQLPEWGFRLLRPDLRGRPSVETHPSESE